MASQTQFRTSQVLDDELTVAAGCENPSLVRQQMQRILESPGFRQSSRMTRFLRHIVEAALAGNPGELKETSIGLAVYDRQAGYDPKTDPVVRNEARRLRQKLHQYYSDEGRSAAVIIDLPKGGYSPVFQLVQEMPAADASAPVSPEAGDPPHNQPAQREHGAVDVDKNKLEEGLREYRGRLMYWSLAGIAVLLCAAAVWVYLRKSFPVSVARVAPLTTLLGQAVQPSISPDGKKVAFAWDGNGSHMNVYVMQKEGRPLRITAGAAEYSRPAWSPDGQGLAYLRTAGSSTDVMSIAVPGGEERRLFPLRWAVDNSWASDPTRIVEDRGPEWTPDARAILVSDEDTSDHGMAIFEHALSDGSIRQLTWPEAGASDYAPRLSPDGKLVAFVRVFSNSVSDIFLASLKGGPPRRLTYDDADIRGIAWFGDSHHLIFSSNRYGSYALWVLDLDSMSVNAMLTSGENATDPSSTGVHGEIVYTASEIQANVHRIALHKSSGLSPEVFFGSSRMTNSAQYSPDGSRIAFTSDRSGSWELWVANADGSGEEQMTHFNGAMVGTPHWSPDSRQIVFDARPRGNSTIFLVSVEDGKMHPLQQNAFEEKQPSWSHDGRWIYFNSNRNGRPALWKSSLDGKKALLLCEENASDPQESPDGRFVYFKPDRAGLWRVSSAGGAAAPVSGLEALQPERLWYVAEAGIYFIDPLSKPARVQFYSFDSHKVKVAAELPSAALGNTPNLSISPDSHWALVTMVDHANSNIMLLQIGKDTSHGPNKR